MTAPMGRPPRRSGGSTALWRLLVLPCVVLALAGCVSQTTPTTSSRPDTGLLHEAMAEPAQPTQLLVTVALAAIDAGFDGPTYFATRHGIEVSADWPLPLLDVHCFVLDLPPDRSPAEISGRLGDDPNIILVQPMNTFTVLADAPTEGDLSDLQHGLREIRAFDAHDLATGEGIRIGVVDTGVDGTHRDLSGSVTALRNFVGFTDPETAPEVHGTAVAGVIGAAAGDGYGITGVAPGADIWGLRACWQPDGSRQGFCDSLSLARAVHFAIQHDIDVVNLSLQGPEDPLVQDLIDLALARGMVLVAARPPMEARFPASVDGVIAVTASPAPHARETRGTGEIVVAPGTDILGPAPGNRFDYFTGSSLAAAHVTGIVALALERAPGLNGRDLADAMRSANDRAAAESPGGTVLDAHELLSTLPDATDPGAAGA